MRISGVPQGSILGPMLLTLSIIGWIKMQTIVFVFTLSLAIIRLIEA